MVFGLKSIELTNRATNRMVFSGEEHYDSSSVQMALREQTANQDNSSKIG